MLQCSLTIALFDGLEKDEKSIVSLQIPVEMLFW
jgi:hypothetical protein